MPSASADAPAVDDTLKQPVTVPVRDAFARLAPGALVAPDVRRTAFEHFERLVLPGGKPGRDWRHDYARVAAAIPSGATAGEAHAPLIPLDAVAAVVRTAGPEISVHRTGVDERSLRIVPFDALRGADAALRDAAFGSAVAWQEDKFASLTVAFAPNGVLVHIGAGAAIERPILIEHAVGAGGAAFPYTLVIVEAHASATIVEDLSGAGFAAGIVEVVLREGARLDYVALQRTGAQSTILMHRAAVCDAAATCRLFVAELGAELSRSVATGRLRGRGASAEIAGLFFNTADQHVELSTLVDHQSGDTTSHTNVRSAASERGQGRYLGNIRIEAHANGSDATLRDDALLLSKRAHIDSVPALEIASNDVKAFHGATIGSIDEAELFYAQSRGIERSEAERMIALGFFEPVVERFPHQAVRDVLHEALAAKATTAASGEEPAA